jgi:hypothetical protein
MATAARNTRDVVIAWGCAKHACAHDPDSSVMVAFHQKNAT